MRKLTTLLAIFGLACLIYLVMGFRVWRVIEKSSWNDSYWDSGYNFEIRWGRNGRNWTSKPTDWEEYITICPDNRNIIKDYWFYQLECRRS